MIFAPPRSAGRVSSDDVWPLVAKDGKTFAQRAQERAASPEVGDYLFERWRAGDGIGDAQKAVRRVFNLNMAKDDIRRRYVEFSTAD